MTFFARRMALLQSSPTIALSTRAKALQAQGLNILDLGVGEPDFPPPDHIKSAAIAAINKNCGLYTPADGTLEIKKAVIHKLKRDNHLDYDVTEISVSAGAKYIIFAAFMATIDEGDEVLLPTPCWVSYPDIVKFFGGKVVLIPGANSNGFKITAQALEKAISPKAKWLVLCSPGNPTGVLYSKEELKAIGEVLLRHPQLHLMSDDIYEYLIYGDGTSFHTMAEVVPALKDRTLLINGASKGYCMTGWRIGYAAGNSELIKKLSAIYSQSITCASAISQKAAVAGLLEDDRSWMIPMIAAYEHRMHYALDNLARIDGIDPCPPQGAFYIFSSMEKLIGKRTPEGKLISDCSSFCEYLLISAGVVIVPGVAFYYPNAFRISFVVELPKLQQALEKLRLAVQSLQ